MVCRCSVFDEAEIVGQEIMGVPCDTFASRRSALSPKRHEDIGQRQELLIPDLSPRKARLGQDTQQLDTVDHHEEYMVSIFRDLFLHGRGGSGEEAIPFFPGADVFVSGSFRRLARRFKHSRWKSGERP